LRKLSRNNIALSLFLITAFLRWLFFETKFIDYDSVNYAFGTISYSIANTRPHLPGSPLFVMAIKLLSYLTGNIHIAFEIVVVLFSSAGITVAYLFFKKIFKDTLAEKLAILLLLNPLVWYYGSVTEIYSFDLFFSALFGLLLLSSKKYRAFWMPLLLAFGAGFRISSSVFFLPVFIYLILKDSKITEVKKRAFYGVISGVVVFLFWFIPMIISVGGLSSYFKLYLLDNPIPPHSILNTLFNFIQYSIFLLAPVLVFILDYAIEKTKIEEIKRCLRNLKIEAKILAVWVLPALLFFIFFHYSKGYILLLLPPLTVIAGCLFKVALQKRVVFSIAILFEMLIFLILPFKQPSINIYFTPVNKELSPFEIFKERLFSGNLISFPRIKQRSREVATAIKLIEKMRKEFSNSSGILFDPTTESLIRPVQYYIRNYKMYSLDIYNEENIIEYYRLNVQKRKIKKIPLLILTRKDFLKKYFIKEEYLKVTAEGDLLIFKPKINNNKLKKIYRGLFIR